MKKHERESQKALKKKRRTLPDELTEVSRDQWPVTAPGRGPRRVWCSKKYLVQLYDEGSGVQRLSINKVARHKGDWADRITWDELQAIKRKVGFGDHQAVEVYPRDRDIVNVANMRHLWIIPYPLSGVGWVNEK